MKTRLAVMACVVALSGCSGGSHSGDGGTKGDGGSSDGGQSASLTSVVARMSGRSGKDLSFDIKGVDPKKDVVGLWVRLLDANGAEVLGFDTNADGVADSAKGSVQLVGVTRTGTAFSANATMLRLYEVAPNVAQAGVSLQDAANVRTAEQVVTITAQQVRSMGQKCDPTYQVDRCEKGLGCRGTPATCQEGLPPTITKLAFYKDPAGPQILLEGTEPEDDLATIHFVFENAAGQPITIDSDGDGTPDLGSFDYPAAGASVDGTFFIRLQGGVGLDTEVPKLVANGIDQAGHVGLPVSAAPTTIPVRGAGASCDPLGFDECGVNLACSPGVVGVTNNCMMASKLRGPVCMAAPVLVASPAGATVIGVAEGVSLWDAPQGCSSNDPTGRPEGVVTLRLTANVATLTLTTALPATNFDTTLYVLQGCPDDSLGALGCSDDTPGLGTASTLVLQNMNAGDYQVVVDSFDYLGGTFELMATTSN